MPINDCPFSVYFDGLYRPILPIKIINPHTQLGLRTWGIIDTGADECAIPASKAPLLGHKLQAGKSKTINTGNGETVAYTHTTTFEIYHPEAENKLLHKIENTPIDFLPNLNVVLLGVNSFLSKFILTVDYPQQKFSIKLPT